MRTFSVPAHPTRRRLLLVFGGALLIVLLLAAGYGLWYFNRPLPEAITSRQLFQGITYTREIRREPHPMIIHIVHIDLTAPGIHFLVTPADDIADYDYRARTVSQFLEDYDLQLAINGDFFLPWRDYGPWDYYPHDGEGVNARGYTVSQGTVVTEGYRSPDQFSTLYLSADNRAAFDVPVGEIDNAISGFGLIVQDGEIQINETDMNSYLFEAHPRTAVGLDEAGQTLILVIVDGRQPNYSDGATLEELAAIMIEYGAYNALNLDGGGSSALIIEGEDGQPVQLGSAIHTRIPARERPVANHLGVYAEQ